MTLDTPEKVMYAFVTYLEARDLDRLVDLYEPDGLFMPEPAVRVAGHEELRQAFSEMFEGCPSLHLHHTEVVRASDLALAANEWTLELTLPDGAKVTRTGRSSIVLRKRDDGSYRIVIDRP